MKSAYNARDFTRRLPANVGALTVHGKTVADASRACLHMITRQHLYKHSQSPASASDLNPRFHVQSGSRGADREWGIVP